MIGLGFLRFLPDLKYMLIIGQYAYFQINLFEHNKKTQDGKIASVSPNWSDVEREGGWRDVPMFFSQSYI